MKYRILPWTSREWVTYGSLDLARAAAFAEACEVLDKSPLRIGSVTVVIFAEGDHAETTAVQVSRSDKIGCAWSPPEYPSGEAPHLSPEEYAMVLRHRAGGSEV